FSNVWAVQLDSNDGSLADAIARAHGFKNLGGIGTLTGHYEFVHDSTGSRMRRSMESRTKRLISHPRVIWAKQQRILDRQKRDFFDLLEARASQQQRSLGHERRKRFYHDPMFAKQWYLQNTGQFNIPEGNDIGVLPVWERGFTGKGVVVSILDDGLDHTHPDLKRNYDPKASWDFNDKDDDPFPNDVDPYNAHGTKCGGEVGAQADNDICGAGVAPNVSLGGIRMLDGVATDALEANALSYKPQYIDIYSNCWGPKDDGKTFGRPGKLGQKALEDGAKKGRGGKGSIYVWATGNGGLVDDDCNCDGYTSSIYTISIGAISSYGLSTYYDEQCSSTMAVTFTGDSHRSGEEEYTLVTTNLHHECTDTFRGTSSAAPLAAGIFALVLEANPNLTWRDLQHLVVHSAEKTSPLDQGWKVNGAGIHFNHKFGFGRLHATRLVANALKWKHVPAQHICQVEGFQARKEIIKRNGKLILKVHTDGCAGTKNAVKRLEHVQATVSLKHNRRGALSIEIRSPMGTTSQLLSTRKYDTSTNGLKDWSFMTVHFWGEDPAGEWEVIITDNTDSMFNKREAVDMEEKEREEINARRKK
ncbi:predicted protein, partial [Nematostella vectensis]